MPVADHVAECTDLLRLEPRIHGHVRAIPVAEHAEALEAGALQVHLLAGELAAGGAEFLGAQLGADAAMLLLHLVLDGQAMAIPPRDVGRVVAVERMRLDHDVLEHLVEEMPEMRRAIGVRRAIVQHEARAAFRDLAKLAINVLLLPGLEHLRLALRQVGLHRKAGFGKVDRALVVCHLRLSD